jgi:DNA mismatch repair protein MutL
MNRDARLAIRPRDEQDHETGGSRRDLTLGFRGEALPSIASVSHFVLRPRAGHPTGPSSRQLGGPWPRARVGAPEGTSIEVADLFYNLPAREFLKSDTAEPHDLRPSRRWRSAPEVGFR